MANWNKKINKAVQPELEPGERFIAGVFLQPSGTMGQSVGMGLGGVVGKAIASKMNGTTVTELVTDSGHAATMPDAATVVGLTDRRVLVFGHSTMTGKPKELKMAFPCAHLAAVEVEKGKAAHRVVMHYGDGSASVYEAPRMANDAESFAAVVNTRQA